MLSVDITILWPRGYLYRGANGGGCKSWPLARPAEGQEGNGLDVGTGERRKGLRNVVGSKKRVGTTAEFVLSQNRNETLVNLRLLYSTRILPTVFLNSQQEL